MAESFISVSVVLAHPRQQKVLELKVEQGCTARQVLIASAIWKHLAHIDEIAEIDFKTIPLGLFGKAFGTRDLPAAEVYQVAQNDRIEILRPLLIDPKEIRRKRAAQAKQVKPAS